MTAPPTSRAASADKLLNAGADAIIGAAASSVSLSVIDKITGAGVVQFSPGEHLARAGHRPRTTSLYFRTSPSDVLQGEVLGNLLIEDGYKNVAILARQDSYGEGLANRVEEVVKAKGGAVATKQLYAADAQNFTAEVNKVAASKPDAVVVVGVRRDQEDRPVADRQGCRSPGPADLLRGRQHRRLLEGLHEGHADGRQGHLPDPAGARRRRSRSGC